MMSGRTRNEHLLGNGDPRRAKFWFIGPEASEDEKRDAQIWDTVWERSGANETCDVREIAMAAAAEFDTQAKSGVDDELRKHWSEQATKIRRNFDPQKCLLQRTWRDLIRLALSFEGTSGPEDIAMRSFQCERLSTDCMLLECRGGGDRAQNAKRQLTGNPNERARRIRELLTKHQPCLAVFYGTIACGHAGQFAKVCSPWEVGGRWALGTYGRTVVGLTPHPCAYGIKAVEWRAFGAELRRRADRTRP